MNPCPYCASPNIESGLVNGMLQTWCNDCDLLIYSEDGAYERGFY
jgi:hypothetical protein